jgi:hypothetical protein
MMSVISKAALESQAIVEACKPHFAGHDPMVQGAALADMTAMWLAGHMGPKAFREVLLNDLIDTIRKLIPVNEKIIRSKT